MSYSYDSLRCRVCESCDAPRKDTLLWGTKRFNRRFVPFHVWCKSHGLALGPIRPPVQWVPSLSLSVVKRQGRGVNHPPQFSAEVKEMLELNLYKSSGDFLACSRANFTFCLRWGLSSFPGFFTCGEIPTRWNGIRGWLAIEGKCVENLRWFCPRVFRRVNPLWNSWRTWCNKWRGRTDTL